MKAIGNMLGGGKARHLAAMIPYHRVEEKFSESRFRLNVRHDHFFPLTSQRGSEVGAGAQAAYGECMGGHEAVV